MPEQVSQFAGSNVEVVGYVERIEPWFFNSRVFVAPLRYGAGMKGKIGQSLGFGLPVVTTEIGREGIGIVHGQHGLIGDNAESIAREVVTAYTDEDLWSRLSSQGRALVEKRFSKTAIRPHLLSLLHYTESDVDRHRSSTSEPLIYSSIPTD
jgi:glycosyltransferase involved in cell wall biosynthesis